MNKALVLSSVSHRFGTNQVLDRLDLVIEPGTIQTLVGTTGAGKSLILRLIAGLVERQEGHIETNGENVSFVFQNNSFLSWLTVGKNLELSTNVKITDIKPLLKRFQLEEYLEMYPKHLSGGTGQKFNLLRAFLNRSNIVLLDEPFSHLDIIQKEDLYNFTLDLWREYRPIILLVTHDVDEALYLSNKISFLSKKEKKLTKTIVLESNNELSSEKTLVTERAKETYLRNFSIFHEFLAGDLS